MFIYGDKTKVDITFKMTDLYKTLNADKTIKTDAQNIQRCSLAYILSPDRTGLDASDNVKEIYIIDIYINLKTVPYKFIEAFNKYIAFQTLFRIHYNNECKYISSLKLVLEDKIKVLKTFETEWDKEIVNEFPITNRLEVVFKSMISSITGLDFKLDESFDDYILRIDSIKKLKSEIEKLTKTMNNEKQPNIKMAMNDKIKQLKKQLQELEE